MSERKRTNSEVTAQEFDRDPAKVYRRASDEGPVTVLDSRGRPSMTIVVPREIPAEAAE